MIEKEDLKDLYVQIPNDYYNNSGISNEELVIYSLLRRNYVQAKEMSIVSVNWLMEVLRIDIKNTRLRKRILKTIELLDTKDIIALYDSHYNSISVKDIKNTELFYVGLELLEGDYFQVNDVELNKIFDYCKDKRTDVFALARYYIALCRVCNSGQNIGYLSKSNIIVCGSNKTIIDYSNILENLGVIYFNNEYITTKRLNAATYFSTKMDMTKEEFNEWVKIEASSRGHIPINKNK